MYYLNETILRRRRILLLILVIFSIINSSSSYLTISDIPSSCPIYITISSISKNTEESQLEINWGPACQDPPEWVGLFEKDPSLSNDSPQVYIETHRNSSGYVKTDVKLGDIKLPNGWDRNDDFNEPPKRGGPKCLPFYIASYNGAELMALDCLKIQPNWMSLEPNIGSAHLKDIFLPGTHCSGCYFNRSNARGTIVKKYGCTQNFDVWTQLVMGIRYLDISVGHDLAKGVNGSKHYWIMNDHIKVSPLLPVLHDIRKFIITSGEVVVLNFNNFPLGFFKHREHHFELLHILENELGDIVFRSNQSVYSYDYTINSIRQTGKTLLITYHNEFIARESDLVWPSWKKHSSEILKPTEISEYMRNLFSKKLEASPKSIGWAFYGTQGVESAYDPLKKLLTVRERADIINRQISTRLGGPWGLNTNAVLLDYFLGTNLIDIAVYINRYKTFTSNDLANFEVQN